MAVQPFDYLVYDWLLTYKNWQSVTTCFLGELREPERRAAKRRVGIYREWIGDPQLHVLARPGSRESRR
jgi:hypothetical protein